MRLDSLKPAGIALLIILVVAVLAAGRPRRAPRPLPIQHNGVHAPYNVKNARGQLMFFNFRAVEPGVLYRGSGFPRNLPARQNGKAQIVPAAFANREAFDFFRQRKIRHIVALMEQTPDFYAEQGYFNWWSQHANFPIVVEALPVRASHAYDRDASRLTDYVPGDPPIALRAATEFIGRIMAQHRPEDGAIYIHDETGKDAVGIVAAAYELWHNQGWLDRQTLWQQVMARYLVSNLVIARDPQAAQVSGETTACKIGPPGYVCPESLEKLRPDLETIAQL